MARRRGRVVHKFFRLGDTQGTETCAGEEAKRRVFFETALTTYISYVTDTTHLCLVMANGETRMVTDPSHIDKKTAELVCISGERIPFATLSADYRKAVSLRHKKRETEV